LVPFLERCAFPGKELLDISQTGSPASRWKSADDELPIPLCVQARIEKSHHAAIIACPQQATEALLEAQHSFWYRERIGKLIRPLSVFLTAGYNVRYKYSIYRTFLDFALLSVLVIPLLS